jgi:hypothetical protein
MPLAGPWVVLVALLTLNRGTHAQERGDAWQDAISYPIPDDPTSKCRVAHAAWWLMRHAVSITRPGAEEAIRVIAWKDPTLAPENPKLLAGYVITDTFWAAKALKPFDVGLSREMERSIRHLGWYGNGLHDVLFHPVERMLHRSADEDFVHGHSLGCFPIDGGRSVDLRVFRQKFDADYEIGHPILFAEHAVFQAIFDFWKGRKAEARRRVLGVFKDDRSTDPNDRIFWDRNAGILVDYVTRNEWLLFQEGKAPTCRHFSFKLGVLLYAIRIMGLEQEIGPFLAEMKGRLWSAQADDGGVAHYVDVQHDGQIPPARRGSTGEATAIAILAETAQALEET